MTFSDIIGLEFDWYAVDQEGHFALFSTAGHCTVPDFLEIHLDAYSEAAFNFPNPKSGAANPWAKFSKLGIVVYDMVNGVEYTRYTTPTDIVKPALEQVFLNLPDLPVFRGSFIQTERISDLDLFDNSSLIKNNDSFSYS